MFNDDDSGFGRDVSFEDIWRSEFTQDMEFAADAGAAALIGRAGYPPAAVLAVGIRGYSPLETPISANPSSDLLFFE